MFAGVCEPDVLVTGSPGAPSSTDLTGLPDRGSSRRRRTTSRLSHPRPRTATPERLMPDRETDQDGWSFSEESPR